MTAQTIELTAHIIQNGFYDFIWIDRYTKVAKQEKKQKIRKKNKRKTREKSPKPKENISSKLESKIKISKAKRDEIAKRRNKIKKTWGDAISSWIQEGVNPFWTSS